MRIFQTPHRVAGRVVAVSTLLLLMVVAANAYTVVMRGGRRVEIPSRFEVTTATLTYEVASGIQVTIGIAAIDIPATEKANHEPAGSLLARAKPAATVVEESAAHNEKPGTSSSRTITNRDLEQLRRRRLESEKAFETRRRELGLPSLNESRKQAAAEFDQVTSELAQKRIAGKETEDYWRQRANALRTEMAALDAEISFVRIRIDDVPPGMPLVATSGSFGYVGGIAGFGFGGRSAFGGRSLGNPGVGGSFRGPMTHRPGVYVAPTSGPRLAPRGRIGAGAVLGRVIVNPGHMRREIGAGTYFGILPNATVFGTPAQSYDFTYERNELITRFNELAAARAGLNARWRALEDEARRAGASPGWLRP